MPSCRLMGTHVGRLGLTYTAVSGAAFPSSATWTQGDPCYGAPERGGAPRFVGGPRCSPGSTGETGGERSRGHGGGVLPAEGEEAGEWGGSWEEREVGPGYPGRVAASLKGQPRPLGARRPRGASNGNGRGGEGNPAGPRQRRQPGRPQAGRSHVEGGQVLVKAVGAVGLGCRVRGGLQGSKGQQAWQPQP
ncbi:hypothetical protein NDU88_003985 [Pleurodeles waltl]|uniref:Uncharacterized protein n=1 Tax=Pleurodeles waltl TaxID=8319 RepID=A0AAV7MCQ0_PLEWA|nr:hypothetical protein NDU88_003985 [Pleurodeles waltl]